MAVPLHHLRRLRRPLFIIGFLLLAPSITKSIRQHFDPILSNHYRNNSRNDEPVPPNRNSSPVRPSLTARRFTSLAVESLIKEIHQNIKNQELAWLFENCFGNTLDTTVDFDVAAAAKQHPDTYIIFGDIDAMWLRDSSVQIHPYLPLMKHDVKLRQLVEGLLLRQFRCIQHDPYANAHYKDVNRVSEWKFIDETEMRDGIHERKWELDSLCYVLRLMSSYWKEVNYDITFFRNNEQQSKKTIQLILQTIKEQRRYYGPGHYTFQRQGAPPDPRGNHAKPNGLIYSYFRPSDELQTFPYLIPSQFFAHHTLKLLLELVKKLNWTNDFRHDIISIVSDLHAILFNNSTSNVEMPILYSHLTYGLIYSYEINGVGDRILMDDSNIPSLLSLPYLCPNDISMNDTIYQNTRKFILSKDNPWFFKGSVLEGTGGSQTGSRMVWSLGIVMRGLTTNDDDEIRLCLDMLTKSHAGSGLMHESTNVNDPMQYTRAWFPRANSLFGELIWKLYREKKYLLDEVKTTRS